MLTFSLPVKLMDKYSKDFQGLSFIYLMDRYLEKISNILEYHSPTNHCINCKLGFSGCSDLHSKIKWLNAVDQTVCLSGKGLSSNSPQCTDVSVSAMPAEFIYN